VKQKFSEKDVMVLLSGLKGTEGSYPSEMIKSRREMFMNQAAAMAVLAGNGSNGSTASGSGQASSSGTTLGGMTMTRLLETALVVVLVVEAGIATYIYRDRIADFINSTLFPRVEQTANPPDSPVFDSLSGENSTTATPAGTVTIAVTETQAPLGPLSPASGNSDNGGNGDNGGDGGDVQITSTPNPDGNPGLHLGQTKQPTQDSSEDTRNNRDLNGNNENNNPKDKGKND
jgi:hypothetical protein